MKLIFAGFRHSHAYSIFKIAAACKQVSIIGATEPDFDARARAEATLNTEISEKSLLSVIDSDADAVVIGARYGERGSLAIAALKAGKHIFADKPLCTSLEELNEIERLSAERNLKIGLLLDLRQLPQVDAAKRAVERGEIGSIHCISFGGQHPLSYGQRPMWYFEKGMHGGTINDISVHGLDLVRYITGAELQRVVSARAWNAFATSEPDFLDCAQFSAELSGGAGLIADVSYSSPSNIGFTLPQSWRFTFWGSKGVLEFNCRDKEAMLAKSGDREMRLLTGETAKRSCLDDFIADVKGEKIPFDTKMNLASTRAALTVQSEANRLDKRR